jgi:hypothetical protein
LTCHGGQRIGTTVFLVGGTVWQDPAGTMPAPGVQVRVRQADGNALEAFSDDDGNFFVLRDTAPTHMLVAPAHPGVRNANGMALMTDVINDADCNSCHRAGGQAPLNIQ